MTNSFVSTSIESKGDLIGEMGMNLSNQTQIKSGLAQKKTSAIADSKKKWMRRI